MLMRQDEVADCPGAATDVIDTVGAGDAFTAAMVLGLLGDDPIEKIGRHACAVAAFVCSQRGATPAFPESIDA